MSATAYQITSSRLLTRPFIQAQIKETSKLRVTGLCEGNSPVTGEFPAQKSSNAENVFIWWRHHETAFSFSWMYMNFDKDFIAACPLKSK